MSGNNKMTKNNSGIDVQQLIKDLGPKISSLSHRMILNRDVAKEAAQEVWYEVIKSLDSFEGRSSISTWVYTIARRTILNYAQKERSFSKTEFDHHFNKSEIPYDGDENGRPDWVKEKCDYCLTAFCHCLSSESRLTFLFKDLAALSYEEISKIMEMSEVNVRKISSRSKSKVENFMNENCFLYNPDGNCKCRIKKEILKIDLQKEYEKCRKIVGLADFFIKFEKELPRKNYWERFL
jgi:RNA polymerase sigma factor (sigma-70 family)